MRAIIDRKIYDTEKAEFIAKWDNGHNMGDFRRCEEMLYRSPKGTYFIYGEGGPMSKYSRQEGDTMSGDDEIVVLNDEGAMAWLEEHNKVDEIEKYFPDEVQEG